MAKSVRAKSAAAAKREEAVQLPVAVSAPIEPQEDNRGWLKRWLDGPLPPEVEPMPLTMIEVIPAPEKTKPKQKLKQKKKTKRKKRPKK